MLIYSELERVCSGQVTDNLQINRYIFDSVGTHRRGLADRTSAKAATCATAHSLPRRGACSRSSEFVSACPSDGAIKSEFSATSPILNRFNPQQY